MFRAARKHLSSVAMLAVAGALVVGGVAVAQSDSEGSSQGQARGQGAGKAGKPAGPPPGGMPFNGLTYGELHIQTKAGEDKLIRLDQGEVSSVSADSITVTENDGNEVTIAVDEETKILGKPGAETSLEDLETGQQVTVTGPKGAAAETIMVMPKRSELKEMKGSPPSGSMPPPPGTQQNSSE